MTKDVRAALGELWEAVKLSQHSDIFEVQAFGAYLFRRMQGLAREEFPPTMLSEMDVEAVMRVDPDGEPPTLERVQ